MHVPHSRRRTLRTGLRLLIAVGCVVAACVTTTAARAVTPRHTPLAHLEPVRVTPGHLTLSGWAFDPDAVGTALTVDLRVDNRTVASVRASAGRPDVAAHYARSYPRLSAGHGFAATVATTDGRHRVCIVARNVGSGADYTANCIVVTVRDSPLTHLEPVRVTPGHLSLSGWAFDPDAPTTPISVGIVVDNTIGTTVRADGNRPDVAGHYAAQYPGLADAHGLSATVAITDGTHTVCLQAKNVSYGKDAQSNCLRVSVHDSPLAHLEPVQVTPGHFTLRGWAFDPDALTSPVTVDALVDGAVAATATANGARSDVARHFAGQYPGLDANHGVTLTVAPAQGTHSVCLRARNIGYGATDTSNCLTVTLRDSPLAYLDPLVVKPGNLQVKGWAFDPDNLATALTVNLAVDGKTTPVTASAARPDVARYYGGRYPALPSGHGFDTTLRLAEGTHQVCATAKNISYGSDTPAGCRTATIRDTPLVYLEPLAQAPGSIALRGWAFDPDDLGAAVTVAITVDGKAQPDTRAALARPDVAAHYASSYPGLTTGHGFQLAVPVLDGTHTVCVAARNIGYGHDNTAPCRTLTVSFEPVSGITSLSANRSGVSVNGWSVDPDTSAAISVHLTIDGVRAATVTADGPAGPKPQHAFSASLPTTSGSHTVCATGVNVGAGTASPKPACGSITLALNPIGWFDSIGRVSGSDDIHVVGWAGDPDSATKPTSVSVSVDGAAATTHTADLSRPDVARVWPSLGAQHGFDIRLGTDDWEHTVCITAVNTGGGTNVGLGCRTIFAVHPTAPSAPQSVAAVAGYGGATVTWQPPSSDGGATVSSYLVTSVPGNVSVRVSASARSATVIGLKASTSYRFTVTATNAVQLTGAAGTSPTVTTEAAPPPQTSPAPISTSRYIRNIHGASSTDLNTMRAEGAADARANPSGHGYLILLDIGGQDHYDGGVVLSATTRFISYGALVANIKSYVAGYASAQKPSAPVTIAIGTNNDMDVSATTGREWADQVVDPVAAYARGFPGITIAGANDIEPGFRAGYSASSAWLSGYLRYTSAPFVFNGSADGCSWTAINRGCNNGWNMNALYQLAAGASPTRILNLPQIYNNTMAAQWKYISLTGVAGSRPRINFGGALTEWTACSQTGWSCGSLTGNNAWRQLWSQLQSHPSLRVGSLPYSTDLRIDK